MGKQIDIKSINSFSFNANGTIDVLVETTDNQYLYINNAYPKQIKNQDQEVTLSYKNKKLDKSTISEKQSNFLNFLKTI